ncbi:hypothetical protein KY348_03300 [Candidatus Woesearchaeota archaeon]|nr:hypothetical protein [Candidatus Woesearchaeota archaeon]
MKGKSMLVFAGIVLCLALFLSACKSDSKNRVYEYVCGDGVCSASEHGVCGIDCNLNLEPEPVIKTPEDILEEFRNRRRVYTPSERIKMGNPDVENDEKILVESFASYLPTKGFRVVSRYNLLSIGENISEVMGVLNRFHLREVLRSARLSSNTEAFGPRAGLAEQFLSLKAGRVVFGVEEDSDLISTYLLYNEGEPIIDYTMQLKGGIFKFFEGESLNFLGHDYFIEEVTNTSMRLVGVSTPDTLFFRHNRGVWINDQTISNNVLNVSLEHDSLRIMLRAEDEIGILPSATLLEHMRRPETLLTNRLNILYEGLTEVPVFEIEFDMKSNRYKLSFITNKNMTYTVPIANLDPLRVGDDDHKLVYKEGSSKDDYVVKKKDYFIIGNRKEYNGLTNVIRLVSVKDNLILFEDPALEKFYVYYKGTPGVNATGDLIIDNVKHKFYVGPDQTLSIDLDGDGSISNDKVPIVTAGNAIIRINSEDGNEINISLITPSEMREHESSDLETNIIIDSSGLSIPRQDLEMIKARRTDLMIGMNDYGTMFILKDYSDSREQKGEDLIIEYPVVQRFADVIIEAYE